MGRWRVFLIICLCLLLSNLYAEEYTVKSGDTLSVLLSNYFTPAQTIEINKNIKKTIPNFYLKAGQKMDFEEDKIKIEASFNKDITIVKEGNSFNIIQTDYDVHTLNYVVSANIDSSLYDSVATVGEGYELAMKLADILEWEIDFFKGIRKGDSFTVVVEKKFCKSQFVGYGNILAIDFINKGNLIRAFYYNDKYAGGYYKFNGDSLKRGFLRVPLKYTRISSYFSSSRRHPIFKRRMPHYGVDYAAPTGTPVYATASGVIVERRYRRGNGNYVKIRHSSGYHTYYMHLSRFGSRLRVGGSVRQGMVIGYVGATGYATGPHLDYRIERFGKFVNPLSFKSPPEKLAQNKIKIFHKQVAKYKSLLDNSYNRYANIRLTM